jgi:hypothetical protein
MKRSLIYTLWTILLAVSTCLQAKPVISSRKEISQHGITWTFEKPVVSGQFITGDWWVIGPVKIIRITPLPGPVKTDENKLELNRWSDTSMKVDTLMRNGSMIVYRAGNVQGYDSRNASYSDSCSVSGCHACLKQDSPSSLP